MIYSALNGRPQGRHEAPRRRLSLPRKTFVCDGALDWRSLPSDPPCWFAALKCRYFSVVPTGLGHVPWRTQHGFGAPGAWKRRNSFLRQTSAGLLSPVPGAGGIPLQRECFLAKYRNSIGCPEPGLTVRKMGLKTAVPLAVRQWHVRGGGPTHPERQRAAARVLLFSLLTRTCVCAAVPGDG